jgi:hypothetical protein
MRGNLGSFVKFFLKNVFKAFLFFSEMKGMCSNF